MMKVLTNYKSKPNTNLRPGEEDFVVHNDFIDTRGQEAE